MRLIIITSEGKIANEIEIVQELFGLGLQCLHVRKPQFTAHDLRNYIMSVNNEYHSRIVIHNHFELMDEWALGGIHLNAAMSNDKQAWRNISQIPSSLISASFHSWQEIRDNTFPYRYVFISPVFDSISKAGYGAAIDIAGAAAMKKEQQAVDKFCPAVIGLGGVGPAQLEALQQHGFDGAAMLGAIWQAADPVAVWKKALRYLTI